MIFTYQCIDSYLFPACWSCHRAKQDLWARIEGHRHGRSKGASAVLWCPRQIKQHSSASFSNSSCLLLVWEWRMTEQSCSRYLAKVALIFGFEKYPMRCRFENAPKFLGEYVNRAELQRSLTQFASESNKIKKQNFLYSILCFYFAWFSTFFSP